MKRYFTIICLLIVAVHAKGQLYGNSWIKYDQTYFKFPILREGIYRIDSTTLSKSFNLNTVNPKNFQIFLGGKEIPIYIKGENDNKINTSDHIEFYASPECISKMDSSIYHRINYVPNPYLPLFNDTVYAFITLSNSINNKRFTLVTDTNTAPHAAAAYFYNSKVFHNKNEYNTVPEYYYGTSDPRYTQGEAYGVSFTKGNSINCNMGNLFPYTGAPLNAWIQTNYSGYSINYSVPEDHQIQIRYNDQLNNTITLKDTLFRGYTPVRHSITINGQTLGNNSVFSILSVANPSFNAFDNSTFLNYLHLFYPSNLNLNNQYRHRIYADDQVSPKGFYNFTNFDFAGSDSVAFYDITNSRKIRGVKAGTNLRVLIPNGSGRKMCYVSAEAYIYNVNAMYVASSAGNFTNYKSLPGSDAYVILYNRKLTSGMQLYKNYRQSAAGGSHNVVLADIDELYEQFAYGINKHPAAVRNFLRFLIDSTGLSPKYLLLLGKSDQFIPTMGIPSSDNLLAAALTPTSQNSLVPDIPMGRLAAIDNNEISYYLSKVQMHESAEPAEWKKKVLHFVGGNEDGLTNLLAGYMGLYEQTIEDTLFGAEVSTFKKNTTAPIQINISDSIRNVISNGAALINFFGHGSEQGFDQAIDDPDKYNNTGKFPFVIANSCYSGNIHIPGRRSVSERFVFSYMKGSIGFLASASTGFVHALHNYTSQFYQAISKTKYNKGIGDIVKEACKVNAMFNDSITKFTNLDMTLHGDPALRISNGPLPDYRLKNSDVSFDLKKHTDSIGVKIKLTNLGSATRDSLFVKVDRFFANGDSLTVYKRKLAPFFIDSLKFFNLIDFNRGIGLNRFKVKIDSYNEITESIETNNSTIGTVDVFIPGGDVLPVYPYKYAIVPKTNTITLKASTTDPFANTNTYRFQLDTCDKFSAPISSTLISSKGGVLEWVVNLPYKDSTVYFWRVSRDSTSPNSGFLWKESSFQTIGNKHGWGQAHFHQFKSDVYQFVAYKKPQRKFLFENNKLSIMCRNAIYPNIAPTNINYFFNNITMSSWGCAPNGWNFAVFDSISGQPESVKSINWPLAGPGTYSNCVCVDNQILNVYSFGEYNYCGFTNWKTSMENFLNAIPANNYVLAYSMGEVAPGNAGITTFSNSLYNAFESIGAVSIRTTPDTVPYILFGKKGMVAGQGHEVKGPTYKSIITLEDTIQTKWNSGYVASEIIGPSFKWNSLHWRVKSLDLTAGDTTLLKVVGIKANGVTDTLAVFPTDSSDVLALSNYANAATYPYLKLVAFMKDNVHRTSPQLNRWQVLYDEAPECAINPLKGFQSINDTLQEGDKVTFVIPVENVGIKNFNDSLVYTYWIEDNNRNKIPLPQRLKKAPFIPGQIILDTITLNSYQLTGNNSLWIFVNPLGHPKYQIEQHQFNNIGRINFKVDRDITNPLLDVTFDGVRILNGDIVSAKPNIMITLKDENKFLELNDTSAFIVTLLSPGQTIPQRLHFVNDLVFTPASLPKNSCMIQYNPVLSLDGRYTLAVQAKDRSMNRSGVQSYQIQFEVNNKPTITGVMNYPNPFSTSTRFVFTLTGSEIPEVFTIQIMTISGKIVREITREELGNLRIGRNITEYAWDGKDNFGDRLGNGVYLYKVITKLNGDNIEKSQSGADKYFVKEFGKMVIMR